MPRRETALQRENRLVRDGYDVTSYEDVHAQTRLAQTKLKAELDTVDRLRRQTEELAGMLEQDVKDIKRTDVVHCFQMAKKRLVNLFEIVDAGEKKPHGQGSSTG